MRIGLQTIVYKMTEKLTVAQRRNELLIKLKALLETQLEDEVAIEQNFTNSKGLSSDVAVSKQFGVIHITTTENSDLNGLLSFDDGNGGRDVFTDKDLICFCWEDKRESKTLFFFATPKKSCRSERTKEV